MKILILYTLNSIRRNKRTSFSIMTAVFISSILLCTLCIYINSVYNREKELVKIQSGNWHGELGGEITQEGLSLIDSHLEVAKSMIKGPYTIVKLPLDSHLPYLLLRNADENYWNEMGEKTLVTKGRIPQQPGEIVVAKSFFLRNPEYQIGDSITLPVGTRLDGDTELSVEVWRENETFQENGSITLTLVGELNVSTSTTIPGYYAMGYLDRSSITEGEEFVVYVQMKNIRKTYQVMPQLADALGIPKNEYGEYEKHFSYHRALLELNLVFSKEFFADQNILAKSLNLIIYGILILLITCAFIFIIQGVFALSARRKLTQLGMFRSIGASPGQILISILLECLILSVIPIFLGLMVGYYFAAFVFRIYMQQAGELLDYPFHVHCSFLTVLLALFLCLITVLISAWIPAHWVLHMSPVEAIREKKFFVRRKKSFHAGWIFRHLGIEGTLASISYHANRKAFRGSVAALLFCLLMTTGFSCLVEVSRFNTERNNFNEPFNITANLQMLSAPDLQMMKQISEIEGLDDRIWFCMANVAYWAEETEQSAEFSQNGGFSKITKPDLYDLLMRDGKWRIPVRLFGIEDSCFQTYCDMLCISSEQFYEQNRLPVIVSSSAPVYPGAWNIQKALQSYPLLSFTVGQELLLEEKTSDSMETDYRFTVSVAAVTTVLPKMNVYYGGDYSIRLYMPLSVYYTVVEGFLPDAAANTHRLRMNFKTSPEKDLAVTERLREILLAWLSDADVFLLSEEEELRNDAINTMALETVLLCIGALLALIGISTAFLTVNGLFAQRRREFAMLRSVGMDFSGMKKMLVLESIRLAITPVCAAMLILFGILSWLLGINEIEWKEFFPYLPLWKIVGELLLEIVTVGGAYWQASREIRNDVIIEAVREDTV